MDREQKDPDVILIIFGYILLGLTILFMVSGLRDVALFAGFSSLMFFVLGRMYIVKHMSGES